MLRNSPGAAESGTRQTCWAQGCSDHQFVRVRGSAEQGGCWAVGLADSTPLGLGTSLRPQGRGDDDHRLLSHGEKQPLSAAKGTSQQL